MPTRRVTIERNDNGRAQSNDAVFNQIFGVPGMKVINDVTVPDPTTTDFVFRIVSQGDPNIALDQVKAAIQQVVPDAQVTDIRWRQPGT